MTYEIYYVDVYGVSIFKYNKNPFSFERFVQNV